MKTFLYNPHLDDFVATPIRYLVSRRRALRKYEYLKDVTGGAVVIDGHFSSIIPLNFYRRFPALLKQLTCRLEGMLWGLINPGFKVYYVSSLPDNYNVLAFGFKCGLDWAGDVPAALSQATIVVLHLSHYFVRSIERSKNLYKIRAKIVFAGDVDITKNNFFAETFWWYRNYFLVIPFCVADRYFKHKINAKVINRVLVTGTVDIIEKPESDDSSEMFRMFSIPTNNRFRFSLVGKELPDWIDSYLSIRKRRTRFKLLNYLSNDQKNYHRIDLVALMVSYKYYCSGNELCGFPAISSFEAVAAGAVTLIVREDSFNDFEIENLFPTFDGSLDGMKQLIVDMEANPEKLKKIKEKCYKYVQENYSRESLIKKVGSSLLSVGQ